MTLLEEPQGLDNGHDDIAVDSLDQIVKCKPPDDLVDYRGNLLLGDAAGLFLEAVRVRFVVEQVLRYDISLLFVQAA